MQMRFYRGNKISGAFNAEINHVASRFWQSRQGRELADPAVQGPMLERALRDWLTDPDGFNSSWDDDAKFGQLWSETRRLWPQHVTAEIEIEPTIPFHDHLDGSRHAGESCETCPG